jgi:hypothetical protein
MRDVGGEPGGSAGEHRRRRVRGSRLSRPPRPGDSRGIAAETATTESARPDSTAPDTAAPESTTPETAASETAAPATPGDGLDALGSTRPDAAEADARDAESDASPVRRVPGDRRGPSVMARAASAAERFRARPGPYAGPDRSERSRPEARRRGEGDRNPTDSGAADREPYDSHAPGPSDDHERGLRGLIGGGSSQVSVAAAMRARDASRPTDEDIAIAEQTLTIVHRGWVPRDN